ncbi:MAG: hypothetical protein ABIJ18_01455 [archaeon]
MTKPNKYRMGTERVQTKPSKERVRKLIKKSDIKSGKGLWLRLRAVWGLLVKGKIKNEWFVPSTVKDKRLKLIKFRAWNKAKKEFIYIWQLNLDRDGCVRSLDSLEGKRFNINEVDLMKVL